MTIPKASFLHQVYKSQCAVEVLARMEGILLLSHIRSSLRNPDAHKRGTMKCSFSKAQFPNLNSKKASPLLLDIINKFVSAGYRADYCFENNGFMICLDWTEEPASRMMWAPTSHELSQRTSDIGRRISAVK